MKTNQSNFLQKILLLLIGIFSMQSTFSQVIKMEECRLDSSAQGILANYNFWAARPSKADSQKYIFPKAKGVDFYLCTIVCQHVKKDSTNRGISVVFGADKSGDVIMVFDKNQNFNFRDDSLYCIPKAFYTNQQWKSFKNIPVIDVDSLWYVDTAGKKATVKISFRAYPPPSRVGKSDYQYKGGTLTIMPIKYYKATIVVADSTYQFRATKFPLTSEFESMISPSEHLPNDEYSILVKRKQGNDTILYGVKIDRLSNRYYDSILPLNKRLYKIYSEDYFTKSFHINELKTTDSGTMKPFVEKKIYPPAINAFLVNKMQASSYRFANSKLTLLYFTGSWCVPCEMAFKDMESFHKKYNDKVKMVAIDKEKDQAASQKYFNRKKIKWDLFYEELNNVSPESIGKQFSVNTYPHYFLMNDKAEVLKETDGFGGIQPIVELLEARK